MLFFKKKQTPDPDTLIQEKWSTDFGLFKKRRFSTETTPAYSAGIEKKQFTLELKQKNLFAWAMDPLYKYSDFILEAQTGFAEGNPYSAMGFIFRYINDENFYYFLISNKGFFRFDVVFNSTPMSLIPWTESSLLSPENNNLMIIAHDSHFSFYADDEWIAEMEDDIIPDGKVAFSAQNFSDEARASFFMKDFLIDSRSTEVEKQYERWTQHIPAAPEKRIVLAKSLFSMGNFTSAAVQMKKALKIKKFNADEYMFFAENLINLRIYDVAREYIDRCLALDPRKIEALQEKANIYYLLNQFITARDFILENLETIGENATLYNLLGNCEYSIGNWTKAEEAYLKAFTLQPDIPLFLVNAARAQEMNKEEKKALENYLKSSTLLFQQEAYGDLFNILPRVLKLDPDNDDVLAFQAKMLFHENKREEAAEMIFRLIDMGYQSSSIYYLAGVIRGDEGKRDEAITFFEKACKWEPGFYLNWYKLAESRFFSGKDAEEDLQKSYDLNHNHPWSLNLFGLLKQKQGKPKQALDYFRKAFKAAPGELDILLNLSDSLHINGEKEEAYSLLENEAFKDHHRVKNHKGNLMARDGDHNGAIRLYDTALRLDPDNLDYMQNLASVCIEMDMILRAEELLLKLYDTNPTAAVLNLVGTLALIKNEFTRAEMSFTEALKLEPENISYRINLISVFLHKQDYNTAKQLAKELMDENPGSAEAAKMQARIRKQFEERFLCNRCSVEWWVPLSLPLQGAIRIMGEPPGDAPAGKCPACKKVICINCAKDFLKEERFTCPECGEFLKLSEDWIKYALMEKVREQETGKTIVD